MANPLQIGVLISGGGSNLQAIIDAIASGEIAGRISFVGSDKAGVKGLKRAKKHNIPSFVVEYADIIRQFKHDSRGLRLPEDFNIDAVKKKQSLYSGDGNPDKLEFFLKTRAIAESILLKKIAAFPFDLLVLAGFMRNLTPYFIDKVNAGSQLPRIMNIHPALLPAFPGVDGYGDTFRYGCKVGGCTVHFIDYGEDSGPIIGQKSFPILEEDTLETVKEKGLKLEWELYPECIRLYADNRLSVVKKSFNLGKGKVYERSVVKIRDLLVSS